MKIKLPKINILKETPEERKSRINKSGNHLASKPMENKKSISAKKQRQIDKKIISSSYGD